MKKTICDHCGNEMTERGVLLVGAVRKDGKGILLPERFQERDFCGPACFWLWANEKLNSDSNNPPLKIGVPQTGLL